MGEGKAVSRKVAVAIGLACIVLLIITASVVANYNSSLNNKDNQIALLQTANANLRSQMSSDNSTINSLNIQLASLQTQLASENTTIKQLQSNLSTDDSTITGLQNKTASDTSEIDSLNTKMTNLNSQITNLNDEITSLKTQVFSLQTAALESDINGFSVVQISDTQYLSNSAPNTYNSLTSWMVRNNHALNLSMVIHTGDIVQISNSTGNWKNANNAMMMLYNNSIPYCWDAGNHDQLNNNVTGGGNPNGVWIGKNYSAFSAVVMRQKPYWAGEIFDGKNTCVEFSYDNYHFMVINLEYNANQTVLAWMQNILKNYPNMNVIIATHNFLNGYGGYGWTGNPADVVWATNFESILNNFPNVFMTLNGHCIGEGSAFDKRVGNREEIFFNMQENGSQTGAAAARIYAFNMDDPSNIVITAYTYQTSGISQYLTTPKEQFSFSANLTSTQPPPVVIEESNANLLGSNGNGESFSNSLTPEAFNQSCNAVTFNNLIFNGDISNFTVTATETNTVIVNYNSDRSASYAVSRSESPNIFC